MGVRRSPLKPSPPRSPQNSQPVQDALARQAAEHDATAANWPSGPQTPGLEAPGPSTHPPPFHARREPGVGPVMLGGGGPGREKGSQASAPSATPPLRMGASPEKAEIASPLSAAVSVMVAARKNVPLRRMIWGGRGPARDAVIACTGRRRGASKSEKGSRGRRIRSERLLRTHSRAQASQMAQLPSRGSSPSLSRGRHSTSPQKRLRQAGGARVGVARGRQVQTAASRCSRSRCGARQTRSRAGRAGVEGGGSNCMSAIASHNQS